MKYGTPKEKKQKNTRENAMRDGETCSVYLAEDFTCLPPFNHGSAVIRRLGSCNLRSRNGDSGAMQYSCYHFCYSPVFHGRPGGVLTGKRKYKDVVDSSNWVFMADLWGFNVPPVFCYLP